MNRNPFLPVPTVPAIPLLPPLTNELADALVNKWDSLRLDLEQAMDFGEVPGSGFLYDPQLDTLKLRLKKYWRQLADSQVLTSCLTVLNDLEDNYGAYLLGITLIRGALILAELDEAHDYVAKLEKAFYAQHGMPRLERPIDASLAASRQLQRTPSSSRFPSRTPVADFVPHQGRAVQPA